MAPASRIRSTWMTHPTCSITRYSAARGCVSAVQSSQEMLLTRARVLAWQEVLSVITLLLKHDMPNEMLHRNRTSTRASQPSVRRQPSSAASRIASRTLCGKRWSAVLPGRRPSSPASEGAKCSRMAAQESSNRVAAVCLEQSPPCSRLSRSESGSVSGSIAGEWLMWIWLRQSLMCDKPLV